MAKKTLTFDSQIIGGPVGKAIGLIVAFVAVAVISHSVGFGAGEKKGFGEGRTEGWDLGSKAGVEKGYWVGREDGCLWVIDQGNRTYVIGIGNPNGGWLFQNLGDTYIGADNCSTDGHGDAPELDVPYVNSAEGTN